jgi:sporulation protein YlmC with PRC-barrel domain
LALALGLTPATVLGQAGGPEADQQPGQQAEPGQLEGVAELTEQEATERAQQQGLIRVANAVDATVMDDQGEELGTIDEVGIDTRHQQAAYAIISSGGILGFGGKTFAVPFTTLRPAADQEGFQADFTKQDVEQAQDFADADWEKLSQADFAQQIHDAFGAQPYWEGGQPGQPGEQGDQPGAGDDLGEQAGAGEQPGAGDDLGQQPGAGGGPGDQAQASEIEVVRASELMERTITSGMAAADQGQGQQQAQPEPGAAEGQGDALGEAEGQAGQPGDAQQQAQGEELGQLRDLIVDMREGKVVYGILTLTEGQLVAVPYTALQYEAQQQQFTLDADPQALQQLAFAEDSWPDLTSEQWASMVHQQLNREPYWQVFGYGSPGQAQDQGQPDQQQDQPGQQPEGEGQQPGQEGESY